MKRSLKEGYFRVPIFLQNSLLRRLAFMLMGLMLAVVILSFLANVALGGVVIVVLLACFGLSYRLLVQITADTNSYISGLSYRIKHSEQDALIKLPIGIMFLDNNQAIEWVNPGLLKYFDKDEVLGRPLAAVDEQLAAIVSNYTAANPDESSQEVKWGDHYFQMMYEPEMGALYMLDITEYAKIRAHSEETRVVLGQIFLDNYDEVTKASTDKDISNLSNYVTNELTNWARKLGMYLRRVDDDHFFLLGYTGALHELEREKFQILDRIRERTSKQNFPLTLSIGLAYGEDDLRVLAKTSQSNLDLALGRGGDQVVVKDGEGNTRYYGGKTNPMEKRTRVRARMISQALAELMKQADQVFVVGHKHPDMDSIGACLGLRRIAAMNDKKCWMVIDTTNVHSDIQRLMEVVDKYPQIRGTIVSEAEALNKATDKSILIMVDHSKPSISMGPKLYERLHDRVVVIDHHRRGEEFPENPMLVYIEPYASSTCELITEMFEYQSRQSEPINQIEATAMLTGIIIDTKSFTLRTGTRTFDAASYLRSVGADAEMVQHFMKENVDSFLARNHLIDRVEFIGAHTALCVGENDRTYDPVTAAQAADALLGVSGVVASFVVTRRSENVIGISARSNGSENVQVIMEQLGGGGHLSNAATQLHDCDIGTARKQLLDVINQAEADQQ